MPLEGLYTLLDFKQEDDTVTATARLNPDHGIFEGHFPGHPVLPGVCVIHMVKELTEKATGKRLFLAVASNVKFMAIINPREQESITFHLTLAELDDQVKVKNSVTFADTEALKMNLTFKPIDG